MGFFDTVRCQAPFPDAALGPEPEFQTYSLGRGMGKYTISMEGRLIRHPAMFEISGRTELEPGLTVPYLHRTVSPGYDLSFHGDILLHPIGTASAVEYVARFTRGTLEWIRPLAGLSETHRNWLTHICSA